MYQVVGFVAVGAAGAAVLHGWHVPKSVSLGFLSLNLIAAAVVGFAQTVRIESPLEPIPYTTPSEMPPTEGFVAPPRLETPRSERSVW
ncbi:hypothetical protein [Methylorubrum rhodesianum]|uniref:hypothetical protein n=1 Tax=Methylorubrum rhodesianum TaxID=29427 RepID=UPI00374737E3